jgi:hypothetical protein
MPDIFSSPVLLVDYFSECHTAVARHLTSVLTDTHELSRIAERSSLHPNGFLKIVVLAATGTAPAAVRVHTWFTTEESADANPHNHRWPYTSLILRGALREQEYVESDGLDQYAMGATESAYRSDQLRGLAFTTTQRKTFVKTKSDRALRRADTVAAQPSRIHRVQALSRDTSTLVVTGSATSADSLLYQLDNTLTPRQQPLHRPSPSMVRTQLARALADLRQHTAQQPSRHSESDSGNAQNSRNTRTASACSTSSG